MNDVGKLLWAITSYIVFVLVHLYLRLSLFLASFTSIGDFYTLQDAILLLIKKKFKKCRDDSPVKKVWGQG